MIITIIIAIFNKFDFEMILVRRASAFLNRIRRHLMVWLSSFIIFLILLSGELKSWIGFAKKSIRTRSYDSVSFCSLVAVGILSVLFLSLSFFFISFYLFLSLPSFRKKKREAIRYLSFHSAKQRQRKQNNNQMFKKNGRESNAIHFSSSWRKLNKWLNSHLGSIHFKSVTYLVLVCFDLHFWKRLDLNEFNADLKEIFFFRDEITID